MSHLIKEQFQSEKTNHSLEEKQIKILISQIQNQSSLNQVEDKHPYHLNPDDLMIKQKHQNNLNQDKNNSLNEQQSQQLNDLSSSLSEEQQDVKIEQDSFSNCCNSNNNISNSSSCISRNGQEENQNESYSNNQNLHQNKKNKSYLCQNKSESSESCSSSGMNKIQNQMVKMNISSSECQEELSQNRQLPQNKSQVIKKVQHPFLNQTEQTIQQIGNYNANSNKFHFNKENYFDILVNKEDQDQMSVQQTIEKYNKYNEIQNLTSIRQGSQAGDNKESSQDLLNLIFCQNQQSLPFSLNIPTSISKFWPNQNIISADKLECIGLEKTINERFINQRKDSSSQNSSENLTTQLGSINEYSSQNNNNNNNINGHSTASSISSSLNSQNRDQQQQLSFAKKHCLVQPLSASSQQNMIKTQSLYPIDQTTKIIEQKLHGNEILNQYGSINKDSQSLSILNRASSQNNFQKQSFNQMNNLISSPKNVLLPSNMSQLNTQSFKSANTNNIINNDSQSANSFIQSGNAYNAINTTTSTNGNNNKKNRICNCKRTKCLKLYCDCFAVGELCGADCKCVECCNNEHSHDERNQAIESILERNPFAFNVKPDEVKKIKKDLVNSSTQNSSSKTVGCNCRKSNCLKKYCLCYQSGLKCSELCKCTECKNLENGLNFSQSSSHQPYSNVQQCYSAIQLNKNNSVGESYQQPQTLYNQRLLSYSAQERNQPQSILGNNPTIQNIIDGLTLQQNQSSTIFQANIQIPQNDYVVDQENQDHQQNKQLNNMLLSAISQFNMKIQDTINGQQTNGNEYGNSPTFKNLSQQQGTRKKLFLNSSGQSTPVSSGGLALQNQQSHLNTQNINNIFSLIKHISTDQFQ